MMEEIISEDQGQTADRTIQLDDRLWESFIEESGGQAACYQCGACTARCPWGEVRTKPLQVRSIIRSAQLGIYDAYPEIWLCTNCGQCELSCPRSIKIPEIFQWIRSKNWECGKVESGLPALLWSLYWNDNPWSQPPSHRARHIHSLNVPAFDSRVHEICLYVGCTASFDRQAQRSVNALVKILNKAGVKYGCLGEDEPCCGEAALSVGHELFFNELAEKAAKVFKKRGVEEIITISPHCYDVFKNHYPDATDYNQLRPFHYSQFLARLVNEGRLNFRESVQDSIVEWSESIDKSHTAVKVTFQDPCYLGRHNGEFEAPRYIIKAIAGIEMVEMSNMQENGLCCGGGGGRMWLETPHGERFSDLRIQEAVNSGADVLVTACPFCQICLEDSRKSLRVKNLRVVDLAEISAISLNCLDVE